MCYRCSSILPSYAYLSHVCWHSYVHWTVMRITAVQRGHHEKKTGILAFANRYLHCYPFYISNEDIKQVLIEHDADSMQIGKRSRSSAIFPSIRLFQQTKRNLNDEGKVHQRFKSMRCLLKIKTFSYIEFIQNEFRDRSNVK